MEYKPVEWLAHTKASLQKMGSLGVMNIILFPALDGGLVAAARINAWSVNVKKGGPAAHPGIVSFEAHLQAEPAVFCLQPVHGAPHCLLALYFFVFILFNQRTQQENQDGNYYKIDHRYGSSLFVCANDGTDRL